MKLGNTVRPGFGVQDDTGAAAQADEEPTVAVYEEGVALAYAPDVNELATGAYEAVIVASGANGFEAGKAYSAFAVVVIGGLTIRTPIAAFRVEAQGVEDLALEAGGNLEAVKAKTDNLPADPADASDVAAGFAALNDVSQVEVAVAAQAALDAQGYTAARAALLDSLDAAISSRLAAAGYTAPDNAGIAAALAAAAAAAGDAEVVRKILENDLDIVAGDHADVVGGDPTERYLLIYDDDGVAVYRQWLLHAKDGGKVVLKGTDPVARERQV